MDTIRILGDSLGVASPPGLANPADSFANRLSQLPGVVMIDHAAGGSCAVEIAIVADGLMYPTKVPADTDKFVIGGGVNDAQRYLTPGLREFHRQALVETICRLSCASRLHAQSMTPNGNWYPVGVPYAQMRQTGFYGSPGDELVGTVSGSTIWVHFGMLDTMQAFRYMFPPTVIEVKVGGIVKQPTHTWACDEPGMHSGNPGNVFGPGAACYTGLGAGPHEVRIKMLAASTIYIAGVTGSDQTANPSIYVLTNPREFQPNSPDVGGAAAAALQQIRRDVQAEFSGIGRNVYLVDCGPDIVQADVGPDNIHWLASGHLKTFAKLRDTIYPPVAPQYQTAYPFFDAAGNYYLAQDANKTGIRPVVTTQ